MNGKNKRKLKNKEKQENSLVSKSNIETKPATSKEVVAKDVVAKDVVAKDVVSNEAPKLKGLSRIMRFCRWCAMISHEDFDKNRGYYATLGVVFFVISIILGILSVTLVTDVVGEVSFISILFIFIATGLVAIKLLANFWYWYQGVHIKDKTYNKSGLVTRFWIWCSGANPDTITETEEFTHYTNVGGTIFSAALLSSIAGGYAISTIWSNPFWLPILGGLIWGFVIIMNIDRLLLSTYNKAEDTEDNRYSKLLSWLAPAMRFFLSGLIAFTISYPLEIAMFRNQINDKKDELIAEDFVKYETDISSNIAGIEAKRNAAIKKFETLSNEQADWTEYSPEAKRLIAEQKEQKKLLDSVIMRNMPAREQIQKRISEAYAKSEMVYDEQSRTFKRSRRGIQMEKSAIDDRNKLNQEEREIKTEGDNIAKRIDEAKKVVLANKDVLKANASENIIKEEAALTAELAVIDKQKIVKREKIKTSKDGLPGDIEALQRLAADNNSIWWTGILLMCIFISVELLPFLAKIFSTPTKYDTANAYAKKKQKAAKEEAAAAQKEKYAKDKELRDELCKQKLAYEKKLLACKYREDNKETLLNYIKNKLEYKQVEIASKYKNQTYELEEQYKAKIEKLKIIAQAKKEKFQKEVELLRDNNPVYQKLIEEKIPLAAQKNQNAQEEALIEHAEKMKQEETTHKKALIEHAEKMKQEESKYKKELEEKLQEIAQQADKVQKTILAEYEAYMKQATTREKQFFIQQEKLADAYLKDHEAATKKINSEIIAAAAQAQKNVANQKLKEWTNKQ